MLRASVHRVAEADSAALVLVVVAVLVHIVQVAVLIGVSALLLGVQLLGARPIEAPMTASSSNRCIADSACGMMSS